MAERMGFEPMVRSRESLVFKTSSINHSDTSPQWLHRMRELYYHMAGGLSSRIFTFCSLCAAGLCHCACQRKNRAGRARISPERGPRGCFGQCDAEEENGNCGRRASLAWMRSLLPVWRFGRRLTSGCGTARRSPPRWCRAGCRGSRRRQRRSRPGTARPLPSGCP